MPTPVNPTTPAEWEALGRPNGSYEAWVAAGYPGWAPSGRAPAPTTPQPGAGASSGWDKVDRSSGDRSPAGFEERAAQGEYDNLPGGLQTAEVLEVQRRRKLLGLDTKRLPPDLADIATRDLATGRLRRARGGSTSSALGLFDPTRNLMGAA